MVLVHSLAMATCRSIRTNEVFGRRVVDHEEHDTFSGSSC